MQSNSMARSPSLLSSQRCSGEQDPSLPNPSQPAESTTITQDHHPLFSSEISRGDHELQVQPDENNLDILQSKAAAYFILLGHVKG